LSRPGRSQSPHQSAGRPLPLNCREAAPGAHLVIDAEFPDIHANVEDWRAEGQRNRNIERRAGLQAGRAADLELALCFQPVATLTDDCIPRVIDSDTATVPIKQSRLDCM
jgi:hypothetical protein